MALIFRPILSLLMVAGIAAGCAGGPEPPRMVYLPPTGVPAQAANARVPQSSDIVFAQLLEELRRSPFTIEQTDRARGLLVATYVGAPEEHVDCGWIVESTPEGLSKTSGASQQTVFQTDGSDSTTTRTLRLNARTAIQLRPAGLDTLVEVGSVYVLSRIIDVRDDSGQQRERAYEVVSFPSGRKGKFASGTVCQPTATLERLALGALPTSPVLADATGGMRSVMPIRDRLDCAGADSSYCEALDLTAPHRQANAQRYGLKLEAYGSGRGVLHEADLLTLDISFPTYPSYLQVAYIERNGRVGQLMPGTSQLWPARAAHYIQETSYEIAEPFGTEMILAVATERPLFATARPRFEPVESYLNALRQSLADLQAENPGTLIAVDAVFVQTEPRPPAASAGWRGGSDLPAAS